jgi:hypothetical protein
MIHETTKTGNPTNGNLLTLGKKGCRISKDVLQTNVKTLHYFCNIGRKTFPWKIESILHSVDISMAYCREFIHV